MSPDGGAASLNVAIASKDHQRANGPPLRTLEDLRLTLPTGQAGAVVGPSGCGKTTLLRLIAGLDQDYVGSHRAARAWAARHGVSGAAPPALAQRRRQSPHRRPASA